MKTKYFVRVIGSDVDLLEDHLNRSGTEFARLNNELAAGRVTTLYSISMSTEEVMALKLSVPLIGCMDLHKTLGKLDNVVASASESNTVQ